LATGKWARNPTFGSEVSRCRVPGAKTVVEYKVEGVEAVFTLESTASGWWSVADAKVAEH